MEEQKAKFRLRSEEELDQTVRRHGDVREQHARRLEQCNLTVAIAQRLKLSGPSGSPAARTR